jgi:hypothetical protein
VGVFKKRRDGRSPQDQAHFTLLGSWDTVPTVVNCFSHARKDESVHFAHCTLVCVCVQKVCVIQCLLLEHDDI